MRFFGQKGNLKMHKIPFSLNSNLSVLEKFAKFGDLSPGFAADLRRALLSLNLNNGVLLKVLFCLALIGSTPDNILIYFIFINFWDFIGESGTQFSFVTLESFSKKCKRAKNMGLITKNTGLITLTRIIFQLG